MKKEINIVKSAHGLCRQDKKIFQGFGLTHGDCFFEYDNNTKKTKNSAQKVCQIIGEGISFLIETFNNVRCKEDKQSKIVFSEGSLDIVHAKLYPSINWKTVFGNQIEYFSVLVESTTADHKKSIKYEKIIRIGCFDKEDRYIEKIEKNAVLTAIIATLASTFSPVVYDEKSKNSYYRTHFFNQTRDSFLEFYEGLVRQLESKLYTIDYLNIEDVGNISVKYNLFESLSDSFAAAKKFQKLDKLSINRFETREFKSEYLSFIPELPTELQIEDDFKPIIKSIRNGDCISFLQHGAGGTGKTINCKLICQAIGIPLMATINCSENLDEYILGKYIPTPTGIEFLESMITKAIRFGGVIVFEEINFSKPQHLAFLNSLLDINGFVRLDNGEIVCRHPNFRFFATMNIGYYGTNEINQALYNRFQIIKKIKGISEAKVRKLLLTQVPSCNKNLDKMIKIFHKISLKINEEGLDVVVSPRNLLAWAMLAQYSSFSSAAEETIIQIARGDEELEETIRDLVNSYKWCENE